MAQSPDTTNPDQPAVFGRRHTDSPQLWLGVMGGSIAAHLLLLFIAFPLIVRLAAAGSGAPTGTTAIPTELIDIAAVPGATTLSGDVPSIDSSTALAPESSLSGRSQPNPSQPQSPTASIPGSSSTTVSPNSAQSPNNEPTSDPATAAPDQGNVGETAPNPAPDTPTSATQPDAGTEDGALAPGSPAGNPATATPTDDSTLSEVGVPGQATPNTFTASLTYGELPLAEVRDRPEISPVPTEQVQPFSYDPTAADMSACTVDPESIRYFGTLISMQVTVGADGTVERVDLRPESAASPVGHTYKELAQCLVMNWKFVPASNDGVAVVSDNLIVSIQIDRQ